MLNLSIIRNHAFSQTSIRTSFFSLEEINNSIYKASQSKQNSHTNIKKNVICPKNNMHRAVYKRREYCHHLNNCKRIKVICNRFQVFELQVHFFENRNCPEVIISSHYYPKTKRQNQCKEKNYRFKSSSFHQRTSTIRIRLSKR